MKYFLIVLALATTTIGRPQKRPHKGRIYGGQDAAPGQFPFIVALNDPDQYCDGSIIAKKWILTAAHCLEDFDDTTTVLVGTHIEHSGGTSYNVVKTIIHEDYDSWTIKNDIGLIQIDGELEYTDLIQPIEFGDPKANSTCIAAGWGITESVDFPPIVQYVELTAIDLDYCTKILEDFLDDTYLGSEQICTLEPKGKGVCNGDSGGPLICDGKLSGIVSYGLSSCAYGYPDVYTKPSAYADWIQKHIQE